MNLRQYLLAAVKVTLVLKISWNPSGPLVGKHWNRNIFLQGLLSVNQLKNYYGQNKQANFVQLLSNLENDINSFKRGSLANTNNQNSVPNLSLLLKGTLGKINFSTP